MQHHAECRLLGEVGTTSWSIGNKSKLFLPSKFAVAENANVERSDTLSENDIREDPRQDMCAKASTWSSYPLALFSQFPWFDVH